ncbi:MAG: hypothetical protein WDO15_10075 [Bacteroidota bacterium]
MKTLLDVVDLIFGDNTFCNVVSRRPDRTVPRWGNWVRTTPFKGSRRSGGIVFTIGNKAYIGLGFNGDDYFADIFEYDLDLGFWKTMTPFPGVPRERAVAFAIDGKAYIGLGYNRGPG